MKITFFPKKECLGDFVLMLFMSVIVLGILNYPQIFRMINGNTIIVRNIKIKIKKGYFFIKKKPTQNHSQKLIYVADIFHDFSGAFFLANLCDINKIDYNLIQKRLEGRGFFHRQTKIKGYTVDVWYCFFGKNKNQNHIYYIFPELRLLFDFNIGGEAEDFFNQIEIKKE